MYIIHIIYNLLTHLGHIFTKYVYHVFVFVYNVVNNNKTRKKLIRYERDLLLLLLFTYIDYYDTI